MQSSPGTALLLAVTVSVASAATTLRAQSSSAGGSSIDGVNTSFNSIGTRGGFNRGTGGTAFMSVSSVNGRPTSFNSFTTGTGTTGFNRFNPGSLGNRGGFSSGAHRPVHIPQIQPIRPFVFPTVPYVGQTNFNTGYTGFGSTGGYNSNRATIGNRFGGNRGGSSFSSASSASTAGTGFGLDVNGYFNALAANINRNFAAGLGRR